MANLKSFRPLAYAVHSSQKPHKCSTFTVHNCICLWSEDGYSLAVCVSGTV